MKKLPKYKRDIIDKLIQLGRRDLAKIFEKYEYIPLPNGRIVKFNRGDMYIYYGGKIIDRQFFGTSACSWCFTRWITEQVFGEFIYD